MSFLNFIWKFRVVRTLIFFNIFINGAAYFEASPTEKNSVVENREICQTLHLSQLPKNSNHLYGHEILLFSGIESETYQIPGLVSEKFESSLTQAQTSGVDSDSAHQNHFFASLPIRGPPRV